MKVIKDLLNSKKFIGAVFTMVSAVLIQLGIPEQEINETMLIISPMLVWLGAQGAADLGKSAAELNQ